MVSSVMIRMSKASTTSSLASWFNSIPSPWLVELLGRLRRDLRIFNHEERLLQLKSSVQPLLVELLCSSRHLSTAIRERILVGQERCVHIHKVIVYDPFEESIFRTAVSIFCLSQRRLKRLRSHRRTRGCRCR